MSLTEFAMLFVPFYPKKGSETEESIDNDSCEEQQNVRCSLITLSDDSKMVDRNVPAVVRVAYFIASSNPQKTSSTVYWGSIYALPLGNGITRRFR
ncbi:ATP-dependent DNA helicase [Trichonephila clavata]|uniref:ATP-dependent DNA helicase n=1 Tax=Trichonephila clavata TaxID=2740835 RepID=A0A8X6FVQ2_TRICU|nr:ATP-dependent DNA helicase [Trichonephila clavata]